MVLGNEFAAAHAGAVVTALPVVRARDLFNDNLNDVLASGAVAEAAPDAGNIFESLFNTVATVFSRDEQNLNQALSGSPAQGHEQKPMTADQLAAAVTSIRVDTVQPMTAPKAGAIDTGAADKHKAADTVAQSTDNKLLAVQDTRAQFRMTAEAMTAGKMPAGDSAAGQTKGPQDLDDAMRGAAMGVATGGIAGGLTSALLGPGLGAAVGMATAFKDIAGLATAMRGQGTEGQPNSSPVYTVAKTRADVERLRMDEAAKGGGENNAFRPNAGGGTMAGLAPDMKKPVISDINNVKDSVQSMDEMGKAPWVLSPQMKAIQDNLNRTEDLLRDQNQNAKDVKATMEERRDQGVQVGLDEAYRAADKGIGIQLAGTQGLRTAPGQFV